MSEVKRYIPGNIWSFLGRAVLFSKKDITKKQISSGLVIEAELFVLGCMVIGLLTLPFFIPKNLLLLTVSIFSVLVVITAYVYNRWLTKPITLNFRSIIHFLLPGFSPSENILLIVISSCALLFFGLGNYLVLTSAIDTNPQQIWQLIGLFVIAFLAGYMSILTPAGFGVREGIVIVTLTKIIPQALAAFIAIFSRIMLIVSEVIFIVLGFIWYKIKNNFIKRIENYIYLFPHQAIVLFFSLVYTIYFTLVSVLRFDNYYTGKFDLGNMDQTIWNTLHGNIFMMTNPNGVENVSRLAFHADFILILLTPIYALWQDPRMLLFVQTIVTASGAYFIFLISKRIIKNKNLSLLFSLAYLINPGVQRANIYDFHAVTLATAFLLATYYFYLNKKYVYFVIFAILAAFCKEQIWLIIALFGLLAYFHHKKRLLGSVIFLLSITIFVFLVWYAIPQALGSQHFALEYYADFGDSPSQIVKTILFSPDKIFQIIIQPDRIQFLKQIFSPLGYMSLLFPLFLIFAAPDLLINLLSNNTQLHQIYYQYTATITPFIFLSAIYGVWILLKFFPKLPTFLIGVYIFYSSIFSAYSFGPLPGSQEPNTDMFTKPLKNRDYIDNYINNIPRDLKVSASNNLGSHLSHRAHLYVAPLGIEKADLVLIHPGDPKSPEALKKIQNNKKFIQIIDKDGFKVFERNKK